VEAASGHGETPHPAEKTSTPHRRQAPRSASSCVAKGMPLRIAVCRYAAS